MKIKRFNCDQCGKNFARGWNLKVLIQNVHEIDSWNKLWGLWQKFHQILQMKYEFCDDITIYVAQWATAY